jgi:hypothetical protein
MTSSSTCERVSATQKSEACKYRLSEISWGDGAPESEMLETKTGESKLLSLSSGARALSLR